MDFIDERRIENKLATFLSGDDIRKLITRNYEDILWNLCSNEYGDEPMENIPVDLTQEKKFDLLRDQVILSLPVVDDVIKRYLGDQALTENSHEKINGIDVYKKAGFLTFWIVKLRPVMINVDPEVITTAEMLFNEQLALSITVGLLYGKHGQKPPFSLKLVDDLKYTLRYRIHARHDLALIYEALCRYFDYPKEAQDHIVE